MFSPVPGFEDLLLRIEVNGKGAIRTIAAIKSCGVGLRFYG